MCLEASLCPTSCAAAARCAVLSYGVPPAMVPLTLRLQDAATVEHLEEIKAGKIDVMCDVVVVTGYSDPNQPTGKAVVVGDEAAKKKLPEGKKWCADSTALACLDGWSKLTVTIPAAAARAAKWSPWLQQLQELQ